MNKQLQHKHMSLKFVFGLWAAFILLGPLTFLSYNNSLYSSFATSVVAIYGFFCGANSFNTYRALKTSENVPIVPTINHQYNPEIMLLNNEEKKQ